MKFALFATLTSLRLDQRVVSRMVLAYLMILLATLGAVIAFWIAHDEQAASRLERQLTRAQMVELSLRQAIVSDWGVRDTLDERQLSHRSRAKDLADNADRVRATDPQQAGQLDMLAQQEDMLASFTATLLVPFRDWAAGDTVEERVGGRAAQELAALGFYTHVAHAPESPSEARTDDHAKSLTYESAVHARLLPVFHELDEKISHFEKCVRWLALGVVLFVAALACLTIADLAEARIRLSNAAIFTGVAMALVGLVWVLIVDPTAWLPVVCWMAFGALFGGTLQVTGVFRFMAKRETPHTPEFEPRQFAGVHLFLRHADNLRERVVIVLIAVTVLSSSVAGYWYAQASTGANEATHDAFESELTLTGVDGERALLASVGAITPALELFGTRMRCAFASQASVLPPADATSTMVAMLVRDRERDCGILASDRSQQSATFVDDQADFDSGDSPGTKVFSQIHDRSFNPAHYYALADGYVDLAERWEAKSAWYIFHLTLFAIALYLLGHSLGMGEGGPAIALAVIGVLVTCVAFGGAVVVHRDSAMHTPSLPRNCKADDPGKKTAVELAAGFYGDARAQLDAATTTEDYQKAADLFGCALAIRPDFGRAQYDRSRADSLIGQGDIDGVYSSFPTRARIAEIAASQAQTRIAIANAGWTPTPRFLNSLGFNTLLAGIATANLAMLNEGLKILHEGIVAGGMTASDGITLDATKLAKASSSDLSVYRMLYTNVGLGQLAMGDRHGAAASYQAAVDGLHLADDRELVASSLSDLNTLEGHCGELHGHESSKCTDIDAGIADARRMVVLGKSATVTGSGSVRIGSVRTWVHPSRVGWSAEVSGFDPSRDTLSVVWSAYSTEWQVWRVVQPLFKPVDPKTLATSAHVTVYESHPSFCLPAGTYRAEFFLNGVRIAGANDKGVALAGYQNDRSREMDIAFCGPSDWKLSSFRQNTDGRHLVRAYTTTSDRSALYLFTFFSSKKPVDLEMRSPVARAWSLLKRLTSSPPPDEQFYRAVSKFTGCQDPIEPGTILTRAWTEPDGLVHVALLVGDAAPNGQACQVLESIGGYYDRSERQLLGRTP